MKKSLFGVVLVLVLAGMSLADGGIVKKRLPPYEYGRVVIDNFSTGQGLPPVIFDHWSHRTMVTCRVCHVDVGFTMQAGGTGIRAADNRQGRFCGACHNGKAIFEGKPLFAACAEGPAAETGETCGLCHRAGEEPEMVDKFYRFAAGMPKERFGNGIDWQAAEERGLIDPQVFIAGISLRESVETIREDFTLEAGVAGIPTIIFSHKKHTAWNGCSTCHPQLFLGVRKGATKYSMIELFQGKYCGVCHDKVAFPQKDCQRCHTDPV